jgi:hypothetical protein
MGKAVQSKEALWHHKACVAISPKRKAPVRALPGKCTSIPSCIMYAFESSKSDVRPKDNQSARYDRPEKKTEKSLVWSSVNRKESLATPKNTLSVRYGGYLQSDIDSAVRCAVMSMACILTGSQRLRRSVSHTATRPVFGPNID